MFLNNRFVAITVPHYDFGFEYRFGFSTAKEPTRRGEVKTRVCPVCYNPRMQRDDTDVVVKLKTESRGVVNPAIVRWIAFVVITVSLVACTVLCILAIWKFTESDAVWRAIATFIVVSIATAIFTFVNEKLG